MLRHTLIKPDGKPIQGRLPVLEWPLSIICGCCICRIREGAHPTFFIVRSKQRLMVQQFFFQQIQIRDNGSITIDQHVVFINACRGFLFDQIFFIGTKQTRMLRAE